MDQPLEYERAKVIYSNEWRYRSWQSAAGIYLSAIVVGLGVFFSRSFARQFPGGQICAWTCIFIGVSGIVSLTVLIALGRRRGFEIRTDGIYVSEVFHPWMDVRRLAAYGHAESGGVQLFYITRGWPLPQHLLTNRTIPRSQYENLIAAIRETIGDSYPDLKLGGYENPN